MIADRTVHELDRNGYVRDWLVGPAWSHPCDDLDAVLDGTGSPWGPPGHRSGRWVLTNGPDVAPLKSVLYARRPLVTDQTLRAVTEGGAISWRSPFDATDTGTLARVHTGWDGLVDWSQFCFTPEYRHAVAATVLEVDQPEWRTLEVACTGPCAVWIGDQLAGVFDEVGYMEPITHQLRVRMLSGATTIVISTWQVAFREVRHVLSMRVLGLPVRVAIPSAGADERAASVAEAVLDALAIERWAVPDGIATITGPDGTALLVSIDGREPVPLVLTAGAASLPLRPEGDPDSSTSMLATGESVITARVDDPACPVARTMRVAAIPARTRTAPVGDADAWRHELLEHVADGNPTSARALARTALDGGPDPSALVDPTDLEGALRMIDSRCDCADFEAVGLVHLLHRIPDDRWPEGLRPAVIDSLLGFKYWIDQPGLDAMCYFTENHQFVWHTAELLVGELFPEATFPNTGWCGAQHGAHGRELATIWMRRKLDGGFSEFDSNAYLAIDSLALCSLVEFAADLEVRELAECLLDKVLLTLASNSWRGVHGAAHGRSYVPTLRSSRFEETAAIMWSLWGTGSLNTAVLPATVLSTARRYRVPAVVRAIALELPDVWDGRQVYRGEYRFHHDLLERPYGSDVRVWKTPDAMLSSVQDYRAGLPGLQEHVWGATLAPEVQVFATNPAADSISSSARPNGWSGQRVLPRVRQHRATVIALHRSGPTHLWFPASSMDEWRQSGPWLSGRVGDGYVAVAADGGFDPVRVGDEAGQAWIPRGDGRQFVTTVGRAAAHGPFAEFVEALHEPMFGVDHNGDPRVEWTDLDGATVSLSWTSPFVVDGRPADLDRGGRPERPLHLVNPAVTCAFGDARIVAEWAGERLELDLSTGRRLDPRSSAGVTSDRADGRSPVSHASEVSG